MGDKMTEQPTEYIITPNMLLQWRVGCIRAMAPFDPDNKQCIGCKFNSKFGGGCNFDDDEMQKIFQSRPVSTLPKGTAPTAEDFDTALKCFGYCGNECKAECNIKSCCIQAGVIAQAARKEGRNEALSDLYRKMIFPVNSGSWDDKTYTDGEWVDAIDDLRRPKRKKEVPE